MKSGSRREVFIGLIAPIGVDIASVTSSISDALKLVNYSTSVIKLTDIFDELPDDILKIEFVDEFDRYHKLIAAGNDLCDRCERSDIFALYGIHRLKRDFDRSSASSLPNDVAHIFRQLKRVEEIDLLQRVFGRNLILISCYSPKENRVKYLVDKQLKSKRGRNRAELEAEALRVISIDEDERDNAFGQRVIDCYPKADYVLDCSSNKALTETAQRMVKIYFGHPFVSPTIDEYSSYIANAASYRSLDLSRQVGAAIFSADGEVVSLGCNEVPKAGGGTYWEGCDSDGRDFAIGHDSNQKLKSDMARDALVRLQEAEWLTDGFGRMEIEKLLIRAFDLTDAPLKKAMINDVIEYGRMVHAEMNAITDAAKTGKSTKNSTLYCTTMPCHLCTKLVIASGISRVVYLQPYAKSLVGELYDDSVSIDRKSDSGKVLFETLKGVTPNGFRIAFRKAMKRKSPDGLAVSWDPFNSSPIFNSHFAYYPELERLSSEDFADVMSQKFDIN